MRVVAIPAIGSLLDGKYRVEEIIGRGGMGVVLAARHDAVGHRVAVKLLLPGRAADPSHARRVLREARAAAALRSEHVARVLDLGELDSGQPYLVMELLQGVDFAQLLDDGGPLCVRDAATYLVQACDAIVEAHARGIVHRDLKPSNLFLARRPDGTPLTKLLDFGVSKLLDAGAEDALTATDDHLGTPHYMSPEQLLCARDVDPRADVWALGVLLYRLITGDHPFDGPSAAAVHVAIATNPAPRLRDVRPDAPARLEVLVQRCLTKPRDKRLQTVSEFAAALLPFATPDTRRRYGHLGRALPSRSAPNPSRAGGASPSASAPPGWSFASAVGNRPSDRPDDVPRGRRVGRPMRLAAWGLSRAVLLGFVVFGAVVGGAVAVGMRRPAVGTTTASASAPRDPQPVSTPTREPPPDPVAAGTPPMPPSAVSSQAPPSPPVSAPRRAPAPPPARAAVQAPRDPYESRY
jgi:serine/threonine-protein kinase